MDTRIDHDVCFTAKNFLYPILLLYSFVSVVIFVEIEEALLSENNLCQHICFYGTRYGNFKRIVLILEKTYFVT